MKKFAFQQNSSCQSTARPAGFFSCHTSNIVLTKDTMIIVSFLLCIIVVMMMAIIN